MRLERVFGAIAGVVVAGGVALAFVVVGSPGHQRALAIDRRRADDLSDLERSVHSRYHQRGKQLPKELPVGLGIVDSVGDNAISYERVDATRYVLCTTFALATDPKADRNDGHRDAWKHTAGRTCYHLDSRYFDP
jgi:hypothetical protein